MEASRFFIEAHECASATARIRARHAAFIAEEFGLNLAAELRLRGAKHIGIFAALLAAIML
jgi:hypothetical protein